MPVSTSLNVRSITIVAIGVLSALAIFATTGCGGASKSAVTVTSVSTVERTTTLKAVHHPAANPGSSPSDGMTSGQRNALSTAKDYVDMGGISRRGLIEQLSSSAGEGYSEADATFAADHVGANWYEEAVQSAKEYLQMGGMSKTGLIEQLSSSAGAGFTEAQAVYAANKVY